MSSWIKWDEMPWEEVNEKTRRKVVSRERVMMILYHFRAYSEWPEEQHVAEQAGYLIQGKIVLSLPDERQEIRLGPGDGYLIEGNKPHSWRVLDEDVTLVDFFSPPRRELIEDEYAPAAKPGE